MMIWLTACLYYPASIYGSEQYFNLLSSLFANHKRSRESLSSVWQRERPRESLCPSIAVVHIQVDRICNTQTSAADMFQHHFIGTGGRCTSSPICIVDLFSYSARLRSVNTHDCQTNDRSLSWLRVHKSSKSAETCDSWRNSAVVQLQLQLHVDNRRDRGIQLGF